MVFEGFKKLRRVFRQSATQGILDVSAIQCDRRCNPSDLGINNWVEISFNSHLFFGSPIAIASRHFPETA